MTEPPRPGENRRVNDVRPARPHLKLTEDGRRMREVLTYSRRGSRFTPRQQQAWDASPDVEQWVVEQRTKLSARGKNLKLHPVDLLKVSTPNTGKGFDIEAPRFVHISAPSALVAYDTAPRVDLRVARSTEARQYDRLSTVACSSRP